MLNKEYEEYPIIDELNLNNFPSGKINKVRINLMTNGMGEFYKIPVIIIKGKQTGPVLGMTAAVHGNELNGITIIHRLIKEINIQKLKGTIVAVPVVNIPAFLNNTRYFIDGSDLNRQFPGKAEGTGGQVYTFKVMQKIISKLNYLIDLHTASFGRINSIYVRANIKSDITAKMAYLQRPQIIVHNYGQDGTLRSAAGDVGVNAITVEVGNPSRFQKSLIKPSIIGIYNVLSHFKMLPRLEKLPKHKPIVCSKSYWLYSDLGGLLEVYPENVSILNKGDVIAKIKNVFGETLKEFVVPEGPCVIVGKSTNPVCFTGGRIVHIGIIDESSVL